MPVADPRRMAEALDWVRRIQDRHFADWDAHIAWLEANPANSDAFDAAALMIEQATAGLAPAGQAPVVEPAPFNDNEAIEEPPSRWRRASGPFVGLALAAGIVGAVSLPSLLGPASRPYAVETRPGESRTVSLADGTQIALNGDTRIRLDRAEPRLAVLERGEALFTVTHDAANPFTVDAGSAVFQDVGTAFDVTRTADRTEIAVREGAVLFDPEGEKLRLDKGAGLRVAANGDAERRAVDPATVGGWQQGRLTYDDAPMREVAGDIARATGRPIRIDGAAAAHRFSGVIVLARDPATMAHRVAGVTGLTMAPDGAGWRMTLPPR